MGKTKKVLTTIALSTLSLLYFNGNAMATDVVESSKDITAPTISVKTDSNTVGNIEKNIFTMVSFKLHDDTAIDKVIINNTERDLVNTKWSDWNFVSVNKNGGIYGENTIKLIDAAGNESKEYKFYLDNVAPTISIKDNTENTTFTIGNKSTNTFSLVSFKLYDAYQIDKIVINGIEKDLTDNKWSDHNFVSIGKNGGIAGENIITLYDIMGNSSSYTFYLDNVAPTISIKDNTENTTFTTGDKSTNTFSLVSFKLYDAYKIDKIVINGVEKDLTDNEWSDHNFVSIGKNGGIAGENSITLYDIAGNKSSLTFYLIEEKAEENKPDVKDDKNDDNKNNDNKDKNPCYKKYIKVKCKTYCNNFVKKVHSFFSNDFNKFLNKRFF